MPALLSVVSYGFHRTKEQSFFRGCALFIRQRLFVNKRIIVGIGAAEVLRRCIATHITVDARRIDVVSAGHIFRHTIVSLRQAFSCSPQNHPQITQTLKSKKSQAAASFSNLGNLPESADKVSAFVGLTMDASSLPASRTCQNPRHSGTPAR